MRDHPRHRVTATAQTSRSKHARAASHCGAVCCAGGLRLAGIGNPIASPAPMAITMTDTNGRYQCWPCARRGRRSN